MLIPFHFTHFVISYAPFVLHSLILSLFSSFSSFLFPFFPPSRLSSFTPLLLQILSSFTPFLIYYCTTFFHRSFPLFSFAPFSLYFCNALLSSFTSVSHHGIFSFFLQNSFHSLNSTRLFLIIIQNHYYSTLNHVFLFILSVQSINFSCFPKSVRTLPRVSFISYTCCRFKRCSPFFCLPPSVSLLFLRLLLRF